MVVVFPENWRPFSFDASRKQELIDEVRNLKVTNPEVQCLRILVHGPVGVGKSSFINSIESIFRGRMAQGALADAMSGTSFTKKFHSQKFRDVKTGKFLPFVISDIMGLENTATAGAHVDDLMIALEGHLKDGFFFNPVGPVQKENPNYNSCPTLPDKVHCLVSILPADKIAMMENEQVQDVICKLREIRQKATDLRIPQVIVMTMVDKACPEVQKKLNMIYRSKNIKRKMQECTNKLGVPMNCVFPVKNYHEEIELQNDIDILLLSALKNILNFANDHVEEKANY
ncbi:hypothetical protein ACEWY4_018202 [Coilia grayii]|uniref:Interferon-induced protein 44-like n=1 Tax=Coilia grayii TaxID=363190 RepID=A0ABD1JIZ0_9TELE